MKTLLMGLGVACALTGLAGDQGDWTVKTAPPVVVRTTPESGASDVDASTSEIRVVFSKEMAESCSCVQVSPEKFPKVADKPKFLEDKKTFVIPVSLEPGRTYVMWLNSSTYQNFMDADHRPSVPYLLVFETKKTKGV